jgi:hypothetical protein
MAQDLKKQAEAISKLVKALAKNYAAAASPVRTHVQQLFKKIKTLLPPCACAYRPFCTVNGECKCNITSEEVCNTYANSKWNVPIIRPQRRRKKG